MTNAKKVGQQFVAIGQQFSSGGDSPHLRGHLDIPGDIFWLSQLRRRCYLASGGQRPGMLLNMQCTRPLPPPTKNFPAPNVSSDEVKKFSIRFQERRGRSVYWKKAQKQYKRNLSSVQQTLLSIYNVLGMRVKDIIPILNELHLVEKTQVNPRNNTSNINNPVVQRDA